MAIILYVLANFFFFAAAIALPDWITDFENHWKAIEDEIQWEKIDGKSEEIDLSPPWEKILKYALGAIGGLVGIGCIIMLLVCWKNIADILCCCCCCCTTKRNNRPRHLVNEEER